MISLRSRRLCEGGAFTSAFAISFPYSSSSIPKNSRMCWS